MRNLVFGAILFASTGASAADATGASAQLSPGKPAGVKAAQRWDDNTPLLVIGAAAIGIGIALAVSNDDNGGSPPVVTTPGTAP